MSRVFHQIVGCCCKHFTAQLAGAEKLCIIEFATIISETAKLTFLEFSRARFQCRKFYKKINLSTSVKLGYRPGAHFFCRVTGVGRGGEKDTHIKVTGMLVVSLRDRNGYLDVSLTFRFLFLGIQFVQNRLHDLGRKLMSKPY